MVLKLYLSIKVSEKGSWLKSNAVPATVSLAN